MSWANLDDGYADHPKVLGLSDAAFRLHTCALCWAARRGTDGSIAPRDLRVLQAMVQGDADPAELVAAELWDPAESGWVIHNWLKRNKLAADIEAKKEAKKEANKARQQAFREKQQAEKDEKERNALRNALPGALPGRLRNASVTPPLSYPILSYPPESKDSDTNNARVLPGKTGGEPVKQAGLGPVDIWKSIETSAGGPSALGLDRNLGQAQPLWLDDNRAMNWAQNLNALNRADPAPTLADWEKLGRWLGAGFAAPILAYQQLSKGGAAGNIAGWLKRAKDWDGVSAPTGRTSPRAPETQLSAPTPAHERYVPNARDLEARRLRKERADKEAAAQAAAEGNNAAAPTT